MKPRTSLSRILTLVVATLFFSACSSGKEFEILGLDRIEDEGLRLAVRDYYRAESNGQWGTAYSVRTPAFQKLVPFEVYAEQMGEDQAGWVTKKIEVLGASHGPPVVVRLRFSERTDRDTSDRLSLNGTSFVVTQDTCWRTEAGRWRVIDAGTRNRLTLNANVADQ